MLNNTDALRAPVAVGLKVTLTVQLADPAKVAPQVVVLEKSPRFVPPIAICQRCIVVLPRFLSVIVLAVLLVPFGWLPKPRLAGVRLAAVPTPVRIIVWGLFPALSLIRSKVLRGPGAVGLNAGLSVQLLPAARELEQVSVTLKSLLLPPVTANESRVKDTTPVLVSVTLTLLLVLRAWVGNVRLGGDKIARGPKLATKFEALTVPIPVAKSHPVVVPNAS